MMMTKSKIGGKRRRPKRRKTKRKRRRKKKTKTKEKTFPGKKKKIVDAVMTTINSAQ